MCSGRLVQPVFEGIEYRVFVRGRVVSRECRKSFTEHLEVAYNRQESWCRREVVTIYLWEVFISARRSSMGERQTGACYEIMIHSIHKSLLIFVRGHNSHFFSGIEALFRLVLERLGKRIAA